ncbi:thioredoxin family protein [Lampropedia puyangensis]|uniref:Thioredoxin family protein n=1 Tax=Lampropedia puyangensis TaxID=1330072 RepID=A0A4S8FDM6_9BURK|nr:thioredoxin family protein [Lampropedia puyangensis]THU04012.1 thioredoxin family protein [Lampropedia puyangensis]
MPFEARPLRLIGLCAAWCGVCREFHPAFERVLAQQASSALALQAQWVDVEDPAISDALGDVDIETFPTVAIGCGEQLLFWGEILPSETVLRQLLERLDPLQAGRGMDVCKQQAWQALCQLLWP